MAQVNIVQLFEQAALEVSGKKLTGLNKDTVIAKLGLDSVAIMELVAHFEEKLHVRLPDEDLASVKTIADLGQVVKNRAPVGTDVNW
jgi:acyl carrier protein